MTFYVGQKVTPKDDRPWEDREYPDEIYPEYGTVYTIRSLVGLDGELHLTLREIRNPRHKYVDGIEVQFNAAEFVPVVEDRKKVSFTAGAPIDSEVWDNRRKKDVSAPKRVRVNT
jgi:hypothetical protein